MPNIKVKYIIDENGDRVAPVTYIDAVRNSSGDSLSDLMVPEKLGFGIGTCNTSSGTALTVTLLGYKLIKNGYVTITFENDVPASSTLNINSLGAKAIYYNSSAIDSGVIKANDTITFCYDGTNYVVTSLGKGVDINFNETLCIHLTTNQDSSYDSDLIGVTVTVTNTDDNIILYTGSWDGTDIILEIPLLTNYEVSVTGVTNYLTPVSQRYYSHVGFTRNITFTYQTELLTLTLKTYNNLPVSSQTVSINNNNYISDADGIIIVKTAFGTSYKVVPTRKTGYLTPPFQTVTASIPNREMLMTYGEIQIGVWAAYKDGTLRAYSDADSNAYGVAVVTSSASFVIDKNIYNSKSLNTYHAGGLNPSETLASNDTQARNKKDGLSYTYTFYNSITSSIADRYTAITTAVNAGGYVPSSGEWYIASLNKTEVDNMMTKISGSSMKPNTGTSTHGNDTRYWSSNPGTDFGHNYGWIWDESRYYNCYAYVDGWLRIFYTL